MSKELDFKGVVSDCSEDFFYHLNNYFKLDEIACKKTRKKVEESIGVLNQLEEYMDEQELIH